MKTFFL